MYHKLEYIIDKKEEIREMCKFRCIKSSELPILIQYKQFNDAATSREDF